MKVITFSDEYLESLISFIKLVWNKNATPLEFIESRYNDLINNPYGRKLGFPIYLLLDNDHVVGHIAATPCGLWANGKEHNMYWISGLHILPEYRGKGVARLLPMRVMKELPTITGFFVLDAPLRIYHKLGWNIIGKIPEYIKIINPVGFISNINITNLVHLPTVAKKAVNKNSKIKQIIYWRMIPFSLNCYNKFWKMISYNKKKDNLCQIVKDFDDRIDTLWERNKYSIKFAQVRKSSYMNWQFKQGEGWVKIIYEEEDRVFGYAILSIKRFWEDSRMGNVKITSIIDLFWDFDKPYVLKKMLDYIGELSNIQNSDVIICSINNKNARNILVKNAYLKIPGSVYFEYYSSDDNLNLSNNIKDWYITRGDADAYGSLGPQG